VRPRSEGAEAVVFHPTKYLLACARTDTGMMPTAPVTVVHMTVASSSR